MAIKKTSKPENKIEVVSLEAFTPDENNANKGRERGLRILDDSLRELGAGRSILVDKHGVILAGNKTQERAVDIGLTDAIVVHTDGKQLVVVQRDDLDATELDGIQMAIQDNLASDKGLDWDIAILAMQEERNPGLLKKVGFNDAEVAEYLKGFLPLSEPPEPQLDKADELREKWGTERGQLWIIPSKTVEAYYRCDCGEIHEVP